MKGIFLKNFTLRLVFRKSKTNQKSLLIIGQTLM